MPFTLWYWGEQCLTLTHWKYQCSLVSATCTCTCMYTCNIPYLPHTCVSMWLPSRVYKMLVCAHANCISIVKAVPYFQPGVYACDTVLQVRHDPRIGRIYFFLVSLSPPSSTLSHPPSPSPFPSRVCGSIRRHCYPSDCRYLARHWLRDIWNATNQWYLDTAPCQRLCGNSPLWTAVAHVSWTHSFSFHFCSNYSQGENHINLVSLWRGKWPLQTASFPLIGWKWSG